MLATYFKELGGLFDRRFLLAYWAPAFVAAAAGALLIATAGAGVAALVAAWAKLTAGLQAVLALSALISVTVLAFLLQAATTPIVRFFEGYWPRRWQRLVVRGVTAHRARVEGLEKRADRSSYRARYFGYPRDEDLILPTRLGNTLRAAEEYAYQTYRMDTVLWWPRLNTQLPESFSKQLDAALTPVLSLLNLSALLGVLAVGGGAGLVIAHRLGHAQPVWLFLLVWAGGLLLAWLSYLAANSQAMAYGDLIRVAFDLYRHKVLESMHIPRPTTLRDESYLWDKLNQWIYYYTPPWEIGWPPDPAQAPATDPFKYDTHKDPAPPSPPATPQQITLTLQGAPTVTIVQKEAQP